MYPSTIYLVVGQYPVEASIMVIEHGLWSDKRLYIGVENGELTRKPAYFKFSQALIFEENYEAILRLRPVLVSRGGILHHIMAYRIEDLRLRRDSGFFAKLLESMRPRYLVVTGLRDVGSPREVKVKDIHVISKIITPTALSTVVVQVNYVVLGSIVEEAMEV